MDRRNNLATLPRPPRFRLVCAAWSLGTLLLVGTPTDAAAVELPATGSRAAVRQVRNGLQKIERLPDAPTRSEIETVGRNCLPLEAPDRCTPESLESCRQSLRHLFDQLDTTSKTDEPLHNAYRFEALSNLGEALSRLAHFNDPNSCRGQPPVAPQRRAHLVLAPDRRHGEIVPDRPLDNGVRYAVVVRKRDPEHPDDPPQLQPIATLPAKAFPDLLGRIDADKAIALHQSLEQRAAKLAGQSNLVGIAIALSQPANGTTLSELQLSFTPTPPVADQNSIASLRTLDARLELQADRDRLEKITCAKPPSPLGRGTLPDNAPKGASAFDGSYVSLDVTQQGTPQEAAKGHNTRRIELPLELLLPANWNPQTPLALIVDGHEGSAARMIERHAKELLEGGLAVLAIDLPAHGTRDSDPTSDDFLDVFAPHELSANIRQSVIDILAVIHHAIDCGFTIEGSGRYQPTRVRYLGYSLGAMIGWISRSVEPRMGTTALIAPGGDLLGWLMLRLGPQLGGRYLSCLGGPDHGQSCVPDTSCAPSGQCVADPFFAQLYRWLEQPYSTVTAAADPLSFPAADRDEEHAAALLMITGGEDPVLHPPLAARLAALAGMQPAGREALASGDARLVQWPALGHDLPDHVGPRAQAHQFVISDGKDLAPTDHAAESTRAPWYTIFAPHRDRR